jgi:hypothetical protein
VEIGGKEDPQLRSNSCPAEVLRNATEAHHQTLAENRQQKGLSLQHLDDTYDEVDLKMWLVSGSEWVYTGVPFLLDPLRLACHQIVFNTRGTRPAPECRYGKA